MARPWDKSPHQLVEGLCLKLSVTLLYSPAFHSALLINTTVIFSEPSVGHSSFCFLHELEKLGDFSF